MALAAGLCPITFIFWSGGSLVVLWGDGKDRVDVNLFTCNVFEIQSLKIHYFADAATSSSID
jgi:hypothetical protein